jgi:hypothetical protein
MVRGGDNYRVITSLAQGLIQRSTECPKAKQTGLSRRALSAKDFKPAVSARLGHIPAKIIGKRLISMRGSAIDLQVLQAVPDGF